MPPQRRRPCRQQVTCLAMNFEGGDRRAVDKEIAETCPDEGPAEFDATHWTGRTCLTQRRHQREVPNSHLTGRKVFNEWPELAIALTPG